MLASPSSLNVLVIFFIRYSAVRKQFGPPGKDEIPVLEYQMQVREAEILGNTKARQLSNNPDTKI